MADMKITKYPQSCLKIERDGRALLVDVGILATAAYSVGDFGKFDAVLFTHTHTDHFDVEILGELVATGAQIYGNANVAQSADPIEVEVVNDNEELVIAGFKIKAFPMEHCLMVDGSPAGIPNTGYLIDDRLLLPGDSIDSTGLSAEIVAVPIFGPDISFKDAVALAKATKAPTLIPVHYDVVGMNPKLFERMAGKNLEAAVVVLESGRSASF